MDTEPLVKVEGHTGSLTQRARYTGSMVRASDTIFDLLASAVFLTNPDGQVLTDPDGRRLIVALYL